MTTLILVLAAISSILCMLPAIIVLLSDPTDGKALYAGIYAYKKTSVIRNICILSLVILTVVEICKGIF